MTYFKKSELSDGEIVLDRFTCHLHGNVAVLVRLINTFRPILTTLVLNNTQNEFTLKYHYIHVSKQAYY